MFRKTLVTAAVALVVLVAALVGAGILMGDDAVPSAGVLVSNSPEPTASIVIGDQDGYTLGS